MNESILRQNQSEGIEKLASALAAAQAKLHGAKKDAKNPFFESTYATLESVYDAIRTPLAEQGLSVIQPTEFIDGQTFVRTVLIHSSGQWIDGLYPVITQKNDPQGLGSGMSYSRRYSLMAMVGIPASDDDAEAATFRPRDAMPFEKINRQYAKDLPELRTRTGPITEKQVKRLWAIAKENNVGQDQVKGVLGKYGWTETKQITADKYDEVVILIQGAGFSPEDWERQDDQITQN